MVLYVGKKLYVIQILESFYVEIIIFPVIFDGQTPMWQGSFSVVRSQCAKMCEIINEQWEKLARKYGLSRNAIEYMRPAFDMRLKE